MYLDYTLGSSLHLLASSGWTPLGSHRVIQKLGAGSLHGKHHVDLSWVVNNRFIALSCIALRVRLADCRGL